MQTTSLSTSWSDEALDALLDAHESTLVEMKQGLQAVLMDVEKQEIAIGKKRRKFLRELKNYRESCFRDAKVEAKKDLEEIRKKMAEEAKRVKETITPAHDTTYLQRCLTIGIFNTIVDQIAMWHKDLALAQDFVQASQAFLFPSVFERVMEHDADYFMIRVPQAAAEDIIFLGRHLIREMRQKTNLPITANEELWNEWQPHIAEWWKDIALPALYGGRSDDWDRDTPWSLQQCRVWNEDQVGRILEHPRIFDAFEMESNNRDNIRIFSGTPELVKTTMATRLEDS